MGEVIGLLLIALLLVYYKTFKKQACESQEANLMDDIPTIRVNSEDLEKHAIEIALLYSHRQKVNCRKKLIKSLDQSYRQILQGYTYIDEEVRNGRDVAPACKWLLDNLYLIEKEYKHIKHNMPKDYYKDLPVISRGMMKGYPRIYHIATELVSHTEGKLDETIIERFVNAYQKRMVLTSGELWALPIMLRIALIQNIDKITKSIVLSSKEKLKANNIIDKIIISPDEEKVELLLEELAKKIEFTPHFTEEFVKQLRENGIASKRLSRWIEEKLELKETNVEKMVHLEHQIEASEQTAMGNSISTIREIEAMDWKVIFEKLSFVENILKQDPAGIYSSMDFESRDFYRHRVEKIARRESKPESYIAKKAIECASDTVEKDGKKYERHVGYYIVDNGFKVLKDKAGFTGNGKETLIDLFKKYSVRFYIGTIVVITLLIVAAFLRISFINDTERSLWRYVVAILVLILPCSEITVAILNWSLMKAITPQLIPKLDFQEGIGCENRTVVVIPAILNSSAKAQEIISNMEVFYLANSDDNIFFALLGDLADSDREENPGDRLINEAALNAVNELNKKYSRNSVDRFYFFNRIRKYNDKENKWMGWERKRGKLMEFNSLIRGDKKTSYYVFSGDIAELSKAKYIISLDTDTLLPRDCAKKLIGAMSHILNEAYIDKEKKTVQRGYGVMQPKVGISIKSANKTIYSKIFSGEVGMDTYTNSVSDVYQDLFHEGIFMGKGIYHIDTFQDMLKDEIPENSVLSHDLLEGIYARAALLTDIEVIDSYPSYYNASSKRLHRWTRGDWQLLPWLRKATINSLSKWKIFDNMRRSLIAPSIILLVGFSFEVLPDGTDKWIVAGILALICPLLFNVTESVTSPIRGVRLSGKVNKCKNTIVQVILLFCFLPYSAYSMADGISRTLYRLYIKKKNLLEWQTAADVEEKSSQGLGDYIQLMWIASLIAVFILISAFGKSNESGFLILPICTIWFASPFIAWYISRDREEASYTLNGEQMKMLTRLSRKTWSYFEDFVNEENHWLAPDNYQEDPPNGLAHRSSPTNIAMGLTSNIIAYDMGYIGLLEMTSRIDSILDSLRSLKGYKGHLYNWYDTLTKEPLYPRYVSTVDNGNLASYLWLVEESLREILKKPYFQKSKSMGLLDTISLANEELYEIVQVKDYYVNEMKTMPQHKADIFLWVEMLSKLSCKAVDAISKSKVQLYWNLKVKGEAERALEEMKKVFPWIDSKNLPREDRYLMQSLHELIFEVPIIDMKSKISKIVPKDTNMAQQLEKTLQEVELLTLKIKTAMDTVSEMVENMDFSLLYDDKRGLFSIGYDVEGDTLGKSYYDLLASEARQASFVAIAKGDVNTKHWLKLGRSMAAVGIHKGLVSWNGTMFEYLMPLLIMKAYPDTLLAQTYKAVVGIQKKYGKSRNIPWGISESAYKSFDTNLNYQYKAFGVPGIGLKRGLKNEIVVSPYSTVMSLQVDISSSLTNMQGLIRKGLEGRYGFYEAIDYTKDRMSKGESSFIIKCYMVHHAGMSLMALDNVLNNNILQERFHKSARVKATELLLQEKIPDRLVYERQHSFEAPEAKAEKLTIMVRKFNTAKTSFPETQFLSNGSYSLMISNSGSGYAKKDEMGVYRWKEDITCDSSGMFLYIRDVGSNKYWSSAFQPCKEEGQFYEAIFSEDKVVFKRVDEDIITHTEIAVSSEEDGEVRKISLTNTSKVDKIIEVTSYCEVTLAPFNADAAHPAFSNLFIQTEFITDPQCVLATRRPRAKGQKKPYLVQCVTTQGNVVGAVQYETSRVNFLGRNRTPSNPKVLEDDAPLNNTVGDVLDPIISMRKKLKIEAGKVCTLAYTTAVADSRESAIKIANKYKEMNAIERVFELAYNQSMVELRYLGIKSPQANLYEAMASRILFMSNLYRAREEEIKGVLRGQRDLWKYGISGDLPIVLLRVKEEKHKEIIHQMLIAHEYWRKKGLKVDLVILNLEESAYSQPLQDTIREILLTTYASEKLNKPGGIFLQSMSTIEREDMALLMAISRIVVDGEKGSLGSQIKKADTDQTEVTELIKEEKAYNYEAHKFKINDLEFFNEIGGFDIENNHYTINLKEGKTTPAPWINVIANENFGFLVSESGSAYTWYKNSRENRITPWLNDWISDPPSEALYVRDEESGSKWSISPNPLRDNGEYIVEHGFGYSIFRHEANGIIGEEIMFVPRGENLKVCIVKFKNITKVARKLSITYFAQLVMGVLPQDCAIHLVTKLNEEKKYISAHNPYSEHFRNLHAYLKIMGGEEESFTGDRTEFLGRGGSIENPKALEKVGLSNSSGAGQDPCLAENVTFCLESGQEKTLVIIFGQEEGIEEIEKTIVKFTDRKNSLIELERVKNYWKEILQGIKVKTPDKSMDIMLNGWLQYQTIACRVWARSGFYQSGGAYGFRDQLQDVMAVGYAKPEITRQHIIYSATRQFTEGDVQHWWHPVVDSGIRTRFTDDLLWLPYVTIDYIKRTGDTSILEETAAYLEDEPLKTGEDERYTISKRSEQVGSIYEHCIKAIERSLQFGPHNIPQMGSGDWNDGMSEVGNKGSGESVWLGWFLYSILNDFIDICKIKNDHSRVLQYEKKKEFIKTNLNENAWDGNWYRRAYFDDGTPLGSIENDECQIDSIAQSWSVISKAGDKEKARMAMNSLEKYLIREDTGMVMLLTPPFENSNLEPGYIKGYVPGVRENGGQYTHAAAWVVLAMAMLGEGDKAWKVFDMLNPINHTKSYYECERYKVEPYVISADVYGKEPHIGRGGWSWYTGAAGWMYRAAVEGILGLKFEGRDGFAIEPEMPKGWKGFEVEHTKGECKYIIKVTRGKTKKLTLDGIQVKGRLIPYLESGIHEVQVVLPS